MMMFHDVLTLLAHQSNEGNKSTIDLNEEFSAFFHDMKVFSGGKKVCKKIMENYFIGNLETETFHHLRF